MKLTAYEKKAHREIEEWVRGRSSLLAQAFNLVMKPVDWAVEQAVPDHVVDQVGDAAGAVPVKTE